MKKKSIFYRIRESVKKIEEEISSKNIDGFLLLNYLFYEVKNSFEGLKDEKQDIVISRVYDLLGRGKFKGKKLIF